MITLRRLAAAQYKGLLAIDLTFPERGSFLIEGRNEAGKSTLFDAIHFALYGQPLVGDIAAAIAFGAGEAEVRLHLDVAGTRLAVRRRARQTAKTLRSEAELEVRRGDDEEIVKGAGPVTQRLQQELGGLTAEALLNSCLVAQKQLGRLETLTRASREEALTILLNLSKLSDVHASLRVRPQDEEALRRAGARVELARATAEMDAIAGRRAALDRRYRLLDLREGCERLEQLQQAIESAQRAVEDAEKCLAAVSRKLERAEALEKERTNWQRVHDAARRALQAQTDVSHAEQLVARARDAVAVLAPRRRTLERYQQARVQVQQLAEHLARIERLDGSAERVRMRLAQRAQAQERLDRVEAELEDLRRRRRDVWARLQRLAPLTGELEAARARLAALGQLNVKLDELLQQRQQLEQLESDAAGRAEADARVDQAQATLAAASAAGAVQEQLRSAFEERKRLERSRALLQEWLVLDRQIEAARRSQRLLDDLALAVASVAHITQPNVARRAASSGSSGRSTRGSQDPALSDSALRLDLVVDHPLTGALCLRLDLWSGGACLSEVRPATPEETQGLRAGSLPTLSRIDDSTFRRNLTAVASELATLGEQRPRGTAGAARRLAAIEAALAAPAPAFDHDAYVQARANITAAGARLEEAQRAAGEFAPAAAIAYQAEQLRRQSDALERAILAEAVRRQMLGVDVETIRRALPHAIAAEQERVTALAASVGERQGLERELMALDQNGTQRRRELEDCKADLAQDDEAGLLAEQARIAEDRRNLVAVTDRLYAEVAALFPIKEPDVATLRDAVQSHTDDLSREVAVLEEQAGDLAAAEEHLASAQDALDSAQQSLGETLATVGDQLSAVNHQSPTASAAAAVTPDEASEPVFTPQSFVPSHGSGQALSPSDAAALAEQHLAGLAEQLRTLDQNALRLEESEAQREAGAAAADRKRAEEDARALGGRLATILAELGVAVETSELASLPPVAAAARVRALCPDLAVEQPSREALERERSLLDQQQGNAERAAHDARLVLGDEVALDPAAAQQALAALELDLAARRRAQEIVVRTRQRMIEKVLPDTINNMCLLLPLLTAGRYRYAELTPDYRLQVWDERKRGYVEKNLYSGGTQDQFSLALRLGFALAALPRELGTSPGFLFLDEPLSSFDRDRTAALVDLLTHGQIATFFQQVFLISHSQAFDPGLFTHHIVMEDGGVARSTLPVQSAE